MTSPTLLCLLMWICSCQVENSPSSSASASVSTSTEVLPENATAVPAAGPTVDLHDNPTEDPRIQDEDWETNVNELKQYSSAPAHHVDMKHIIILLKETYDRRRLWISSMMDGGIAGI